MKWLKIKKPSPSFVFASPGRSVHSHPRGTFSQLAVLMTFTQLSLWARKSWGV